MAKRNIKEKKYKSLRIYPPVKSQNNHFGVCWSELDFMFVLIWMLKQFTICLIILTMCFKACLELLLSRERPCGGVEFGREGHSTRYDWLM